MSSIHDDEIRLLGDLLQHEESLPNVKCPSCNGGMTFEKSFSITRTNDGLVYNCYRASCNMQGFTADKGKVHQFVPAKTPTAKPHIVPKKEYKAFDKPTYGLTVDQHAWFTAQFNMTASEVLRSGVKWCPMTRSYIFPIWNRHNVQVGTVDRSWMQRKPKSINRWEGPAANLYFPKQEVHNADRIVLVEDVLSAIKVARYQPCVALLGCNLSREGATLLRRITDTLVIALDNDATNKALELSKKHSWMYDSVKVQHLALDPKDMSDNQLKRAFDREY